MCGTATAPAVARRVVRGMEMCILIDSLGRGFDLWGEGRGWFDEDILTAESKSCIYIPPGAWALAGLNR